jgi:3-methyladenine DNA glycosylase AlkD
MRLRDSFDAKRDGALLADGIISEVNKASGGTQSIRAVRKRISKQIVDLDRITVLAAAHELIERSFYGRFVGYEIVYYHPATLRGLTEKEVVALGKGIDSWGSVDTFSIYVSGPAWRLERLRDRTIQRWARSRDRWWRRAALVSTVPLNARKPPVPDGADKTIAICLLLIADRDDMVVKAMSWALRALAEREPERVREFLSKHKVKIAARVIREVRNKLTTGLKNPRKTGVSGRSSAAAASSRQTVAL